MAKRSSMRPGRTADCAIIYEQAYPADEMGEMDEAQIAAAREIFMTGWSGAN